MDIAVPAGHRIKLKESEKNNEYLDLTRELKNIVEHESNDDTNCRWRARYNQ